MTSAATDHDRKRFLPAPVLGSFAFLTLSGFVPLLMVAATRGADQPAWPLALLSTILAGARFAWVVSSASRRLYEMATWLFCYLFFGLAPLAQLRTGTDPSTTPALIHEYDTTALSIGIAFQLCLIVGSFFARKSDPRPDDLGLQVGTVRRIHRGRLIFATLALLAVSVFYASRIGFASVLASRNDRSVAAATAFGDDVVTTVLAALVSLGLLIAVVGLLQDRRERQLRSQRGGWFLLLCSAGMLLFLVNPFGSPRFVLVTVYLGVLAAVGIFGRPGRFRWVSLVALSAMVFVFPILDSFRRSTDSISEGVDPITSLLRGDYDSYAQTVNTVMYVDQNGITWGNQLLGVLLFWVPRSLWPGKPYDTGIFLADFRGYGFNNLSAPLPAELYINFGWTGVIVGSILLGMLLRRLDASSERRLRAIGLPTILGCALPFYMVLLLRGSLLQAASNLVVMLVVWWFITTPRADLTRVSGGRDRSNRAARAFVFERPRLHVEHPP